MYVAMYMCVLLCIDCPVGTEYRDCSWDLSCSNITGVRRCKDQSSCTSGCFCSNQTVLINGTCSDISSCSGITICTYIHWYVYVALLHLAILMYMHGVILYSGCESRSKIIL